MHQSFFFCWGVWCQLLEESGVTPWKRVVSPPGRVWCQLLEESGATLWKRVVSPAGGGWCQLLEEDGVRFGEVLNVDTLGMLCEAPFLSLGNQWM